MSPLSTQGVTELRGTPGGCGSVWQVPRRWAAGVSRSWLYTQPDISGQIRRLRQKTDSAGSAGPPCSARGLHRAAGSGVFAEPVVDPAAAHAARGHQVGDRRAVRAGPQQCGPERRLRPVAVVAVGRAVSGRLGRL
jgi:hypothetical protein